MVLNECRRNIYKSYKSGRAKEYKGGKVFYTSLKSVKGWDQSKHKEGNNKDKKINEWN